MHLKVASQTYTARFVQQSADTLLHVDGRQHVGEVNARELAAAMAEAAALGSEDAALAKAVADAWAKAEFTLGLPAACREMAHFRLLKGTLNGCCHEA